MHINTAMLYDVIYAAKDYADESDKLHHLIQRHQRSGGQALLDVACGTGRHLAHLEWHYNVQGLDLSADLLTVARERLPAVQFHQANMIDFRLDDRFDVITCLFSAINHLDSVSTLQQALRTMSQHLRPGGVLIIEPTIKAQDFRSGYLAAQFVDHDDLKMARMSYSRIEDDRAVFDIHFLVGTPDGVSHLIEPISYKLFSHDDYEDAFGAAGLAVAFEAEGLRGFGVYVGKKPRS